MKLDRIRTGLLGYGLSGSVFHAPLLSVLEEFDIKKVMTSRKEQVNSEIPEAEAVSSIEDITGDPNIDLVIVTMPSGLHFEAAKECLLAGKHVVLEKPMTATAEEAEELIHLATEKGVLLSVYHNRRWDNDFLTIKQLISEGRLGDINTFHASYDRYRPNVRQRWREQKGPGSGALYDLGSHLIDQVLHLFGLPEAVTAQVAAQRDGAETDDYFHIVLHYGKLQAILHSGSIVPANGPRYQVHGQKGSFIKYGIDSQEDALRAGQKPSGESWGADLPEHYGELTVVEGEEVKTETVKTLPGSYVTYYQELAASILKGGKLPVTAEEGLAVIRIIEAARESSELKKTVLLNK
ncbi:oxidoreductase [Bacillus sonorensis]|uniref:oxidoreductase n=1 Tax=Bacillus sonorensis TaxID=119858 RepID=UPI001EFFE6F6|nr:oxidoreductase [Bacillus sonorensis]MCF7616567.1 oxidoreductase [Bacillus sonorensis]MCY8086332.1 oxidoreductase [Bacillus sonorensis]MCY8403143.1 oxidoreductase [Bacillus sonorensis]MEC1353980.1 oxidoreductase [Bacillus sonorensis]MEC1428173.1 oxidoreductase [Bacillus sonorensis]